jgi:hypothetical protein
MARGRKMPAVNSEPARRITRSIDDLRRTADVISAELMRISSELDKLRADLGKALG